MEPPTMAERSAIFVYHATNFILLSVYFPSQFGLVSPATTQKENTASRTQITKNSIQKFNLSLILEKAQLKKKTYRKDESELEEKEEAPASKANTILDEQIP